MIFPVELRTILTPLEWENARISEVAACVVFDVLRATTVFATALHAGVKRIFPAASIAEAIALREKHPGALLGGERGGEKIPGFDLGNSPAEYLDAAGQEVISTTTNGTAALRACARAEELLAAGFVNLEATASWLKERKPHRVMLVCAGTGRDFALEDGLAAGALAGRLGCADLCAATQALRALHAASAGNLASTVAGSANAMALARAGRTRDIEWALATDSRPVVVRACGEALVAEAPGA